MKLEMRGQMRLEQKMILAPHMIQSMEILQLPILALQERIEQELNNNPVLEIEEGSDSEEQSGSEQQVAQTDPTVEAAPEKIDDFGRLENLDDNYREFTREDIPFRRGLSSNEPDKKLEALKNTAAPTQSLHEYLTGQWGLVEMKASVKKAGGIIIDYIDDRGYLTVRLEQLHNNDRTDFTYEDLQKALELVQTLEPAGVGARDLKECLSIQMTQSAGDMGFEQKLVAEHFDALLENRLPAIAKKMDCSIERINLAIEHMRKLDTSPGLQIGPVRNQPVNADVIVEEGEEPGRYVARLAESNLPNLRVSDYYVKMVKTTSVNEKTKDFLQNNIRSAQWIISAIEQRKNTLLRVTRAIVKFQREFFDKGQLHLKPLPMAKVADEVGVHLATVSRAVAGKYVQCSWGILPLRKFFSGGTEDTSGNSHSWEAVRAKLQQIIDSENKSKPLSDDQIRKKLAEKGIENLARRTIAKYRKLMNIPAARFRKRY